MREAWSLMALSGLAMLLAAPVQAAEGLKFSPDSAAWPAWQARLSVVMQPLSASGSFNGPLQLGAAKLSGDRYFGWGRLGDGGGLRATSALLVGDRLVAMSASPAFGNDTLAVRPTTRASIIDTNDATGAAAYVGVGYSAWWLRSGLGLSADLGLIGQRTATGVRLGDSVDSSLRAMQLAPVLQVNLSYSF